MGYYDFDEHFWAANEVCGQQAEIVNSPTRFFSLRELFSLVLKQDSYQDEGKPHEGLTRENPSYTPKKRDDLGR